MAGILYYFPNRNRIGRDEFLAAFPHTRLVGEPTNNTNTHGPDGKGGVVIADPQRVDGSLIRFEPTRQKWVQIPGSDNWIGCYTNEHKPTPEDLALKLQIDGHFVDLADGGKWLAPVARLLTGDSVLPARLTMDANRNWVIGDVMEQYAPLWALACRWYDFMTYTGAEENRPPFLYTDFVNGAVACLSANYVISADEVMLLGLLVEDYARSIYYALIDLPSIETLKKKEEPAG
jgi:hypothetical protein